MKNQFIAISVLMASIGAANMASAACDAAFQEASVSGTVDTLNVSQSLQVGTIDMRLTSVKKDKVLFDQRGAIVGQVVGMVPGEGPLTVFLDHDITFANGVEIETSGDTATVYGDPTTQLDVPVMEVIDNFWGSKIFRKATGEIVAQGTLNILQGYTPAGDPILRNEFELSGTLCLKD